MDIKATDAWGLPSADLTECRLAETENIFHDSFNPVCTAEETSTYKSQIVPLPDTKEYLAHLEEKLSRLQGKTASKRQTEKKRLLDGLLSSRLAHTDQFLHSEKEGDDFTGEGHGSHSLGSGAVNPQGTLGAVMRKVTPDKVALTPEELQKLLEADILAKIHDHRDESRPQKDPSEVEKDEASVVVKSQVRSENKENDPQHSPIKEVKDG